MKIAVVGSKKFNDYEKFKEIMDEFLKDFKDVEFVSGGADGADSLAQRYARDNGIPIKIYYSNWRRFKKAAGPIRNKQIWEDADIGIAFWNGKSRGTWYSLKFSKEMHKNLWIYNFLEDRFYKYDG
jgi:hypothetical protein